MRFDDEFHGCLENYQERHLQTQYHCQIAKHKSTFGTKCVSFCEMSEMIDTHCCFL